MHASWSRGLIAAAVALCVSLGAAGNAAASGGRDVGKGGKGVPDQKISIQLWTFAEYIGFGTDAATIARTEEVLSKLRSYGYRNVEPFTLSGLTAEQYRALLRKYGLRSRSRHVDVGSPSNPQDIEQIIADNRTLGIKFFGSGATPNDDLVTEADWVAYAKYLDQVGERARRAGQTLMVHNHDWEFEKVYNGRTGFDILMANTSRRNVVFQLDLYWATLGGADPVALLRRYGQRIQLFHVKDMRAGDRRIEIVGRGTIDFPRIFAAGKGWIRYYVVEHDPRFGDPTFDPFEAARVGFNYLDNVRIGKDRGGRGGSQGKDRNKGNGQGKDRDKPGRGHRGGH